jgi:hypothetical protein
MVPATHAAHDIEATAENLREELVRLGIQKQALERELAAVVAHLGSVQQTLGALQVLMVDPSAAGPAAPAVPAEVTTHAPTSRTGAAGADAAGTEGREAESQRSYGRITDQIMEYFAGIGTADVRARDVAAALHRDTDSGSINAVRSTLDRLVATSRLQRTGRGLYSAKRS